jgi:CBS domain-containing protein
MQVRTVMTTDPVCCVPSDTAMRAACIMKDKNSGIVPVLANDRSRKVVGVVTDRDLCFTVVAEGQYPNTVEVQTCMTTRVVTCLPDESSETALDRMRENQVRRIIVVDKEGNIQGIVALADMVRSGAVRPDQLFEYLRGVSEPADAPSKPRKAQALRKTA